MTTPDFGQLLPKGIIVTALSTGTASNRPIMPDGIIQVTMEAHTQTQPAYYAHGGLYSYANLGKMVGKPGRWTCTYRVAATGGETRAYPHWVALDPEDVGKPCTITWQRIDIS